MIEETDALYCLSSIIECESKRDITEGDDFIGKYAFDYCEIDYFPFTMHTSKREYVFYPYNYRKLLISQLEHFMPKVGGIYFLFESKEIVYVGIASNLKKRIKQHYLEGVKDFTHVLYICIENENDRIKAEKFNIKHYKPKYNIQHNTF